jgi:hypothetical protein
MQGQDSAQETSAPKLEDLVPIAVVIAAGCERCAERMVRRALQQGSPRRLVERTLGIVAHVRSTDCFVAAVGPEVVARMDKPLEAGRRALVAQGGTMDTACSRRDGA